MFWPQDSAYTVNTYLQSLPNKSFCLFGIFTTLEIKRFLNVLHSFQIINDKFTIYIMSSQMFCENNYIFN